MIASTKVTKRNPITTRVSRPFAISTRFAAPARLATVVVGPNQSIQLQRPAQGPFSTLAGPNAAPIYLTPSPQVIAVTQVTQGLTGAPGEGYGLGTPISPVFAWSGGVLVGVTYSDGSTKSLTWGAERLERIDFERPALPGVRKDFSYNLDGTLAAVAQTAF